MIDWTHESTEKADGLEINFYTAPEVLHPRDLFDDSVDDIDEICQKINDGLYMWFVAKVTASKAGVELASEYLGGCLYESYEQFVTDNDYYADMRDSVIKEAKQKIQMLTEV